MLLPIDAYKQSYGLEERRSITQTANVSIAYFPPHLLTCMIESLRNLPCLDRLLYLDDV